MGVDALIAVLLTLKDEASDGIDKAKTSFGGLTDSIAQAGAQFLVVTGAFEKVTSAIDGLAMKSTNFELATTRAAIKMEKFGVTADDVGDAVKDLADKTAGGIFTAQETAAAFEAVSNNGKDMSTTLGQLTAGMNLASLTGGELTSTTKEITSVIGSWGLAATDAAHVSDVLANTYKETGASTTYISDGLSSMGAIMSKLGMSVEEGAATLAVFKKAGIDSTRGLMTAFMQLSDSESGASVKLKEMGISATDMSGNLKSPIDLITELGGAGLSTTEILGLFGLRGSAPLITAMENIGKISTLTASNLDSEGEAAEAAGDIADSSAGKHLKTKAAMEDMQLAISEGLVPALTTMMEIINPMLQVLTEYPEIIYAIAAGFIVYKIATIAAAIATAGGTAAIWANTIALLANPIVLIAVAVALLILGLYELWKHWGDVTAACGKFNEQAAGAKEAIGKIGDALQGPGRALKAIDWDGARDAMGDWADTAQNVLGGLPEKFKEWGIHMITAWIDGMKSGGDGLKDAIGDFGEKAKDFLGFSTPPPEGALHDVPTWGQHMIESYVGGIISKGPDMERAMSIVTKKLQPSPYLAMSGPSTTYSNYRTDARQANVEVHQHITNLDANQVAAMVRREIENVLGG